jgi:hypothetical protein
MAKQKLNISATQNDSFVVVAASSNLYFNIAIDFHD